MQINGQVSVASSSQGFASSEMRSQVVHYEGEDKSLLLNSDSHASSSSISKVVVECGKQETAGQNSRPVTKLRLKKFNHIMNK